MKSIRRFTLAATLILPFAVIATASASNVKVSRFWHNHQPIYWPDWAASQPNRVQFAKDSIDAKNGGSAHPDNNLNDIFGHGDRVASYQSGPRNSLANTPASAGYAISYSGSLMENVRSLGNAGYLGYSGNWFDGYRDATRWTTPAGGPRMDMVGFTYHHSLGPVLPKAVFRKEIQIFKQAWWKAWGKNMDLSDHSKGFFPTEMAFTTEMIDVLRDEGYEWVIVASHHLSRTCPTYKDQSSASANYNINSSEPNRADLIGPSPTEGWWYASPNPGNAAWNVSPFAYQLHKVQYVNPETGAAKQMVAVPSDDVLSYKAGYSGAEKGMADNIAHFASDPSKPVIILPATDGDNAWGGGSSSWNESWPSFTRAAEGAGWDNVAIQDMVNQYGDAAALAHIEDGAWIFPEMCYGSPYFLKWVDPPANVKNLDKCYPGTQVDLETPGFALKFWDWAPIVAGANWCETAEQIMKTEGGAVDAWKIATPYEWSDGSDNNLNEVEKAWHIYLCGLDSGFNYYGGLGNDDECKPPLANRNSINVLRPWMTTARMAKDATPPTVFRPQRFPYNPGGYTFGWFNNRPDDGNFRKKMGSNFYVWTHAYDLNGIPDGGVVLHIRRDLDGVNSLDSTQNETFAGGSEVADWMAIPMTKRRLPKTVAELNAAADNGQIDYEFEAAEIADYYFAKVEGFRDELLDYYIEARDSKGNISKSDIQHVYVEDDGTPGGGGSRPSASFSPAAPSDCADITVTFNAQTSTLASAETIYASYTFAGADTHWTQAAMTRLSSNTFAITFTNNTGTFTNDSPALWICFTDQNDNWENNNGNNWRVPIADCDAPVDGVRISPMPAHAGEEVTITYYPSDRPLAAADTVNIHHGYNHANWTATPGVAMNRSGANWSFTYLVPSAASNLVMCFNNGTLWDNNSGSDWSFPVTGTVVPTNPPAPAITNTVALTNLTSQQTGSPLRLTYNPVDRPLAAATTVRIHYGIVSANGAVTNWTTAPGLLMTAAGSCWTFDLTPSPGSENLIVCFNDSGSVWDNNSEANWSFNLGDAYPDIPAGLVLTDPANDLTVAANVSNYTFRGTAAGLDATLIWTNSTAGESGTIPVAVADAGWSVELPLQPGANTLRFIGTRTTAEDTNTLASDSATGYTDWGTGANQGSGFGSWTLNGAVENQAGFFIAGADNANCSIGIPSWGLWANSDQSAEAVRAFAGPLQPGQTFSWQFDNNSIDTGKGVGTALQNAAGETLWQFFFNGGDSNYSHSGGATDIPWTGDGISFAFTLTDATHYSATVHPTGRDPVTFNGALESTNGDSAIARFRAWNYSAGSGGDCNVYLNSLALTAPASASITTNTAMVVITRLADEFLIPSFRLTSDAAGGSSALSFVLDSTVNGATYVLYECTNLLAIPQSWIRLDDSARTSTGGPLTLTNTLRSPAATYRLNYTTP